MKRTAKNYFTTALVTLLILGSAALNLSCTKKAGAKIPEKTAPVSFAGCRCSMYGIRPFPSNEVTLKFSMLSIPIGIICGFLLAYILNMKVAGMKGWRTLYYLPSLISGVVIAMLWRGLFDDQYGIINYIIRQFGGSAPKWLLDPKYTLYCFLFLSVWSCGGSMIIYLSGLQGIPTELYEAAELDGCNKWQQMIHVTIQKEYHSCCAIQDRLFFCQKGRRPS